MSDSKALRMLGSPDVRNAVLLNEIGVLLHDLGKLSKEFIAQDAAFPFHLILRRLSRGKDPYLGTDTSPRAALRCCLGELDLNAEEKTIADLLRREMAELDYEMSRRHDSQHELEEALNNARKKVARAHERAFDQMAPLFREVWADLRWQREAEERIAAIRPPFISIEGFYDGLDQLPFVADLMEMRGRTWHSEALLRPEVKLLRALHEGNEISGRPKALGDKERLAQVRQLYCEVLANQFLEIYNIRKDGPGDLGSWFWKARLYPQSEATCALLRRFDEGATLESEEREAVHWMGVRPITQWAYSKLVVGRGDDCRDTSLWEHSYEAASLHKSTVAQVLIEGRWQEPVPLCWRLLRVSLQRPAVRALGEIKQLVEVEYPLGNELYRDEMSIHFTFPGLEHEAAAQLSEALRKEIIQVTSKRLRPHVSYSSTSSGVASLSRISGLSTLGRH